jgi:putative ABC transport system permease protein
MTINFLQVLIGQLILKTYTIKQAMLQSIFLASKYILFHKTRSLVLVFSIGIIIYLPGGLQRLIEESEERMIARAEATPLLVGARGSSTDMVINSLYFQQERAEPIDKAVLSAVNGTGFGYAIPLITMFSARNFPIVGTDQDYFTFRNLQLASGHLMSFVGDCVIGSSVSEQLNIGVGDSLVSSPENPFDLAGVYPLKMNVTGVLKPAESPDDLAVFVDVKTNWVILGLGHGHEDLTEINDRTIILERDSSEVKAGAKLMLYNTIVGDNIDSFHFHGDMKSYPLNALIFVPNDQKSETLFRGRFETGDFDEQVIVPKVVVNTLLQSIFRIKEVFNTVFVLVGLATLLILGLIIALSVRLREKEISTMYTIGSSRMKVFEIIALELLILSGASIVFASILYLMTGLFVDDFIRNFII